MGKPCIVAAATVKVRSSAVTETLRPRVKPAGSAGTVAVTWPSLVRRTCTACSSRPSRVIPMLTMVT